MYGDLVSHRLALLDASGRRLDGCVIAVTGGSAPKPYVYHMASRMKPKEADMVKLIAVTTLAVALLSSAAAVGSLASLQIPMHCTGECR